MGYNQFRSDITFFAATNFRKKHIPFGIKTDDRRRHMYIIGKTGMGKTAMMENMIIQDIHKGSGVALVDPHGDTAERLLNCIPSYRINDVVYFNPADLDFPIAFNVLEKVDYSQRHLVASGLMGVFTKIWANVWSARMEYILNNTILALLEVPGNTLLGITRMLIDEDFRNKIVKQVKDPIVKSFWEKEFASYKERYRTEAVAPIQNKVGQFLSSSIIRNIVGQTKSTINLRKIMDEGKILILNLSKGRIGEDASALLGAMMITKLQIAAMSRVDIPEDERKDFYLYVDEFQNFSTESFADILSEARKYRLNLILAHQYMAQLDESVKNAVLGNVGTMVAFALGPSDAKELSVEYEPYVHISDLVNVPKFHIYIKPSVNGMTTKPFYAKTLPPLYNTLQYPDSKEKIIKVSRERYAKPKEMVERNIFKWLNPEQYAKESAALEQSSEKDKDKTNNHGITLKDEKEISQNIPFYTAVCDNCGREVKVEEQIDENTGILCKECRDMFSKQIYNESQQRYNTEKSDKKDDFNIFDYLNSSDTNDKKSVPPGQIVKF